MQTQHARLRLGEQWFIMLLDNAEDKNKMT
jgi:hypothetical protein